MKIRLPFDLCKCLSAALILALAVTPVHAAPKVDIMAPASGSAHAAEPAQTISMDLGEAYLDDVLKLLSKQSGMNFAASEAVSGKKITLYFDKVPVMSAIETLLNAYHLTLIPQSEKNLYVISESGAPKIPTVTRVFQLRYARVIPTHGDSAASFGNSGSLIKESIGGSSGSSTSSTSSTSSSGTTAGGETGGGPLSIVHALLTENGSVVADTRTNSMIITDIAERVKVIEETLKTIDVKPKQIYIEAEILEVTLDTLRRIGLEYGSSTGQVGSFTGPIRKTYFPFSRGLFDLATQSQTLGTLSFSDANVLLKLLATEKEVKFLARPRLLTLSNEVAEIRIVAEAVTGITSDSQATTGTVTTTPERTTVGTILRVTPMVNDGKYITMVIEPEVSRVIQSASFSSFLDPNRRVARTTVMVPDKGTAMIAGLISRENTDENRKVPGLGDLPIIGSAFKRTGSEKKDTEILLFITPHILEDDEIVPEIQFSKEREQSPVTAKEESFLRDHRKKILKERAISDTVDSIVW